MVVSSILYFHPYLGKIPILTHIFQRGGSTTNLVGLFGPFLGFSMVSRFPHGSLLAIKSLRSQCIENSIGFHTLLMEKIPNNHRLDVENPVNNGTNLPTSTGAGFPPSLLRNSQRNHTHNMFLVQVGKSSHENV